MNRLRAVATLLGLAAIVSSYWWAPAALRPMSFFGVRRVEVVGARYLMPETVVLELGLRPAASVFDDLGTLERRLAQVGGITQAVVRRRLPATLRVELVEEEPIALAEGPGGLVPLARDGKPLPYDMQVAPVDVPIVQAAERPLLEALSRIQITDLGLYSDVASARARGGEVVLDLNQGRVRLGMPVDPEVVHSISAVRRQLASLGVQWRELDGRFKGWVVVRKDEAPRHRGTDTRARHSMPPVRRVRPVTRTRLGASVPRCLGPSVPRVA